MKGLALVGLLGVLLLAGACATDIYDVRLESVRPIAGMQIPTRYSRHDPQSSRGVVAEFSSERDLRRQVARFGLSFFAVVERCAGRTHIEDPSLSRHWISHGEFVDELGVLADAGLGSVADPRIPEPAVGAPRNGRFFFLLPLHLKAYASERLSDVSGWEIRRVVDEDWPAARPG